MKRIPLLAILVAAPASAAPSSKIERAETFVAKIPKLYYSDVAVDIDPFVYVDYAMHGDEAKNRIERVMCSSNDPDLAMWVRSKVGGFQDSIAQALEETEGQNSLYCSPLDNVVVCELAHNDRRVALFITFKGDKPAVGGIGIDKGARARRDVRSSRDHFYKRASKHDCKQTRS